MCNNAVYKVKIRAQPLGSCNLGVNFMSEQPIKKELG